MEGEFTGASAQTMGAADVAGQQSGQEAVAQAQVQQQPANVPDAQGQGTQEETFDSLIRGRYKQDFDSAVQKVVKQRVRGLNQYKGQAEAMAPIIDQLGALYGIDTSDPRKTDFAALAQRFSADERLYSAEAMEKGTTTDARGPGREYGHAAAAAGVPDARSLCRDPGRLCPGCDGAVRRGL